MYKNKNREDVMMCDFFWLLLFFSIYNHVQVFAPANTKEKEKIFQ
jgi:hypothetical protein